MKDNRKDNTVIRTDRETREALKKAARSAGVPLTDYLRKIAKMVK